MARKNQDGKDIKLVLSWLCGRRLRDDELAAALDMAPTNYGRRRSADNFPSYEELQQFGDHFGLSARALQLAFGLRDEDELALLDEEGMRQYLEQGGGNHLPNKATRQGQQYPRNPRFDRPPL